METTKWKILPNSVVLLNMAKITWKILLGKRNLI